MDYPRAVVRAVKLTVRNPIAIVLISLSTTVALLPFLAGVLLAGVIGGIVGLWTSSMLLGFVAAGGARISTVLLERNVSMGTSYFWEGIRRGRRIGPIIGVGTFLSVLVPIVLSSVPLEGVARYALVMVGVYVVLTWFVVAMYALSLWAGADGAGGTGEAFRDAGVLILERPTGWIWLLIQAAGWTLIAIPLVIAPILLLPGFVQVIGTAIVHETATANGTTSVDSAREAA